MKEKIWHSSNFTHLSFIGPFVDYAKLIVIPHHVTT